MLTLACAILLIHFETASQQLQRYTQFSVPLNSGTINGVEWGPPDRTADHATVAITRDKRIACAFHTSRPDIAASMRQVEVALFNPTGYDTWTYWGSVLVGDAHYDPLNLFPVAVKCERPDIIAAGDSFYVVWTRRYDFISQHPAALECAWIRWEKGTYKVYNNRVSSLSGFGFILDQDSTTSSFRVQDCAGVPDAVVLDDGDPLAIPPRLPTVAVAYPHQRTFVSGGPPIRDFDLRLVACTLDTSNPTLPVASTTFQVINQNSTPIRFDGPDSESAGLILPELARGSSSSKFVMAYDEQFLTATGSIDGRIRLHLFENQGGIWSSVQSHTFGTANSPLRRRRPTIASFPEAPSAAGRDVVSIAFNKEGAGQGNADVVYEEWILDPNAGVFKAIWPAGSQFPNDPAGVATYDFRPVPIHGRDSTFRRCAVARFLNPPGQGQPPPPISPRKLLEYFVATNLSFQVTTGDLGRPAAAYLYDGTHPTAPDYVALSWEQGTVGQTDVRIQLLIR